MKSLRSLSKSKSEKEYCLEADIHSYKDPRNERREKWNTIHNDKNINSKLACRNEKCIDVKEHFYLLYLRNFNRVTRGCIFKF